MILNKDFAVAHNNTPSLIALAVAAGLVSPAFAADKKTDEVMVVSGSRMEQKLEDVSGPIAVVSVIWQFTNIWNDFLFGVSFGGVNQPMTVALNNLVQSSTGVKEYNVHFAGAILAALPTLLVYIVAGRYFVRGLMAGSVKG